MKAKIIIALIASGIIFSFGASKIGNRHKTIKRIDVQSSSNRLAEPLGGFVSEDH